MLAIGHVNGLGAVFDSDFQNAHKIDEINTAIACDNMKLLDELLLDIVDVNVPDSHNNYPIQIAVEFGNAHALISLINNGSNPNIADRKGYTPLMRALDAKYIPNRYLIVVLLLNNGADVNILAHNYKSALYIARSKNSRFINLLKRFGAKF